MTLVRGFVRESILGRLGSGHLGRLGEAMSNSTKGER